MEGRELGFHWWNTFVSLVYLAHMAAEELGALGCVGADDKGVRPALEGEDSDHLPLG